MDEIAMHTKMPENELEMIKGLGRPFSVIFDVGARDDIEFNQMFPGAEVHLFEPNPVFATSLVEKLNSSDGRIAYVNVCGLSDEARKAAYNPAFQAVDGSEAWSGESELTVELKTLDSYVAERNIQEIDFLKIDTEGNDYKVLLGGINTIKKCRYIQYEHWNNIQQFHDLLEKDFFMEYVGNRNVLCTRRRAIQEKP